MAAVDYFLKLEPIKGESQDQKHKDEIQLLTWGWSMQQTGKAEYGSGAGAGKVRVDDLHFTHYLDKASPDLHFACANGKHFKDALLTCRKAGEKPVEYLKIKLEDVLISSVQASGGHGDEERIIESVTLNFAKFVVEYTEQKPDGSPGPGTKKGWDMAANVEHNG
jgi:type VI secretion system secreted protein Hcp